MKQKGRLGGAAWFYAQGQRAYHLMYHGAGAHALNALVPQWARDAFQQGFADVARAHNLRKEFSGVYGRHQSKR